MVENYLLAKKLATDKCGSDSEFFPFMVCALFALLQKYPNHNDMISDLFMRTVIIFETGSIADIILRNQIEVDGFDIIQDDEEKGLITFGVSNQGHSFFTDENGEVSYEQKDPFVICSLDHENMAHFLNTFCHEFGHLIKGEMNGCTMEEDDDHFSFVIRNGLAHYVYYYQDHFQEFRFITAFSILDECINCIQTTEALGEIEALKDFIEDPNILSFIETLDKDEMRLDRGYEAMVKLVRELWEDESFKSLVEDNIVLGNIDEIVNTFNHIVGNEAFENMSQTLDSILEKLENNEDDSSLDSDVSNYRDIVQKYRKKAKNNQKTK